MADLVFSNRINSSSIFSVKNLLLLSITFLFLAFLLKLYVPIVFQFSFTGLPMLWTSLATWFTPPYLYFVVNFIILAIAASSRFHQRNQEVGLLSPMKMKMKIHSKESYDVVRKSSGGFNKFKFEYDASFEGKDNIDDVQAMKKPVETRPKIEATEVMKTKKKQMEAKAKFQAEARDLELKIKKKSVEFKLEAMKKYGYVEEEKKSKMEDEYAPAKSPVRMNTVDIPMDYSSDQKGLVSHHLQLEELQNLQGAGKEESSAEEENDTLDGTWKMIMESRRIQNAAGLLQGAAPKKVAMFHNLRSPPQSTRR